MVLATTGRRAERKGDDHDYDHGRARSNSDERSDGCSVGDDVRDVEERRSDDAHPISLFHVFYLKGIPFSLSICVAVSILGY